MDNRKSQARPRRPRLARWRNDVERFYLDTIEGSRDDFRSKFLRALLSLLSVAYGFIIAIRNNRFDRAAAKFPPRSKSLNKRFSDSGLIKRASIPVLSVGNLTTGGTGKTPLVVWMAKVVNGCGKRTAIISRGYGAKSLSEPNDETLEVMAKLPDVHSLSGKSRYAVVERAIRDYDCEIAILDDGFQHRHLARDLDVVLIDGTLPFGYDRLLPRGLLREPLTSLKRADVIVITRCELIEPSARRSLIQKIQQLQPYALTVEASTQPEGWLGGDGQIHPLSWLHGKRIYAFCGIGNPSNFQASLERLAGTEQMELELVGYLFFPDHYRYQPEDLLQIHASAKQAKAEVVVCTHKDLVKLTDMPQGDLPLVALLIEISMISNQEPFLNRIKAIID